MVIMGLMQRKLNPAQVINNKFDLYLKNGYQEKKIDDSNQEVRK